MNSFRCSRCMALSGVLLVAIAAAAIAQTSSQPQSRPETRPQAPTAPRPAESRADDAEPLVYVLMSTSKGDIVLELNRDKAPVTVANFLKYVDSNFYEGTIFHRIMPNFMIQGGGFTADMKLKKPDAPIKNEWQNGLQNVRGTIAMARLGDRQPNPNTVDSATCQFFINVKDNPVLDQRQPDGGAYCVFGRVVVGMDWTVEQIRAVPVVADPNNPRREVSKPTETVSIQKVARLTPDEAKKRIDEEKSAAASKPSASQPATTRPSGATRP